MSANELKELLALPEYRWVKEDLLPAYYVLSKMGFGLGNGYQFLPTSEENLLLNLKAKIALSELREVEQIFANWVGREREEAGYNTGTKGYSGHDYGHNKHHSGNAHEIRITITGPLLDIGKEQFKMIKRDLKFDFEIKTIYDLFFFKYLLLNTNVTTLEDTGLLSFVTKDGMWDWWKESANAKSIVRNLISSNKAFLSDAVLETIMSKLTGDREIFYEFMDSIPERYKVAEHHFNSSSCSLHYKYAIPSEVWSGIRAKIEGIDYVSIIKPSLSKLEEEYRAMINEISLLEILKQERVDANNPMKRGDYERFSDVIERLNTEGFIKISPVEDIILSEEGRKTIVDRIRSLGSEVTEMILSWLNEVVEVEKPIKTEKVRGDITTRPDATPTPGGDKSHPIQIKNYKAKETTDAIKVFLEDDVFWEPGSLNNGHFILIGGSGAGKTETIRCVASELDKQGYPALMIDFHGDMACENCNIKTYEMKESGEYYFNPLELDPQFEEITPLRATSDFVDAIFINFPGLGIQQRGDLKEIIKKSYNRVGITSKKETWSGEIEFEGIENEIKFSEDKTTQTLNAYLNDIFDYELFSGSEKISIGNILEGGITHLNLKPLPETLRFLFADLFMRKLYYSLQSLGEIPRGDITDKERFRLFVIVDEAKMLVSEKQGIKAVLNKYATELRKFGVGLILASQLITHFTDEILSNIAVKLCMKAENKEQARKNNKFFGVGENEIINLEQGEGILIIGEDKIKVKIVPSWER